MGRTIKGLLKKNLPIKQVGAKRTRNRAAGDGEDEHTTIKYYSKVLEYYMTLKTDFDFCKSQCT